MGEGHVAAGRLRSSHPPRTDLSPASRPGRAHRPLTPKPGAQLEPSGWGLCCRRRWGAGRRDGEAESPLGTRFGDGLTASCAPPGGSVGLGGAGGLGKAQPTGAPLPRSWCSEESRSYAEPTPLASPSWMDTRLQPRRTRRSQGGQGRAATGRAEEQAALGTEVQPPGTAGSLGALRPLTALCRPPRKPVRSGACGRRDGQGAEGRPAGDQLASNPAPPRWGAPSPPCTEF